MIVSIYTDGDFHLSDKEGNILKNDLPYQYLIKINTAEDIEDFAHMFYCNDFGINNPDALTTLSIMIDDVRLKLLEVLNKPDSFDDIEDELIFENGNYYIKREKST
jgi:hypothetical protein